MPPTGSRISDSLKSLRVNAKLAKKAVAKNPIKTGVGVAALVSLLRSDPSRRELARRELDESVVRDAEIKLRAEKTAKLMEQARMEKAIQENTAILARSNPNLYTSVLAGRRVPAGSVVLGGRPRTDLMQELAASMGSGRFRERPNPLSDLIG